MTIQRIHRIILLLRHNLLCFILCLTGMHMTSAQTLPGDWMGVMVPTPEEERLFRISEAQYNHRFRVALPDDNQLYIDFLRLSDWGEKHHLNEITRFAADEFERLADSFREAHTVKVMELNIPTSNKNIAIRYREERPAATQLLRKNGSYYHLKTGMDTLRVVKNTGYRTRPGFDSGIVQIQYTFIVKHLEDIRRYATDPAFLEHTGNSIDSVIAVQRGKWKRQDLRYHELRVDYDLAKKTALKVYTGDPVLPFMGKTVGLYLSVGAMVFKNSIAPRAEMSLAYIFPGEGNKKPFAGITINSFYLYHPGADGTVDRVYSSINGEFGVATMNGLMRQKTSFGLGYVYAQPVFRDEMIRVFVNYGASELITVGWEMNANIRRKEDVMMGIHVSFTL